MKVVLLKNIYVTINGNFYMELNTMSPQRWEIYEDDGTTYVHGKKLVLRVT